MANLQQSQIFFELLLKDNAITSNPRRLALVYNEIGTMYIDKTAYRKSFDFFNRALKLQQQYLSANDADTALTFYNIACVYSIQDESQRAYNLYQQSLEIQLTGSHPNKRAIARCYNSRSAFHFARGHLMKALDFCQSCLRFERACLSDNHPALSNTYSNIGSVYLAQKNFKEASSIQLRSMMPGNNSIGTTYHCLAMTLLGQGRFLAALENAQKAADIFVEVNDPRVHDAKEFVKQIRRLM